MEKVGSDEGCQKVCEAPCGRPSGVALHGAIELLRRYAVKVNLLNRVVMAAIICAVWLVGVNIPVRAQDQPPQDQKQKQKKGQQPARQNSQAQQQQQNQENQRAQQQSLGPFWGQS